VAISDFLTESYELLTLTPSTAGVWGSSGVWAISSTILGRIRYTGGKETYVSDKDTVMTTHRVYVLNSTALSVGNRLQRSGKVYDVKNIASPINAAFSQVDVNFLDDTTAISASTST
jgi:head-tail adaptor